MPSNFHITSWKHSWSEHAELQYGTTRDTPNRRKVLAKRDKLLICNFTAQGSSPICDSEWYTIDGFSLVTSDRLAHNPLYNCRALVDNAPGGLARQNETVTELPPSPTSHLQLTELRSEAVSQCAGPCHNTACSQTTSLTCLHNIIIFFHPVGIQKRLKINTVWGWKAAWFTLSSLKRRTREGVRFKTPISNKKIKTIVWQILKWNISVMLSFFVTGCLVLFFLTEILAKEYINMQKYICKGNFSFFIQNPPKITTVFHAPLLHSHLIFLGHT